MVDSKSLMLEATAFDTCKRNVKFHLITFKLIKFDLNHHLFSITLINQQ